MSTEEASTNCEDEVHEEEVVKADKFRKMRLLLQAGAHFQEAKISERLRLKRFGASEEEMKTWAALKRMGVTEEERELGDLIFSANPADLSNAEITKIEKITGYSENEMKRAKALQTLGASEEECSESLSIRLGSIGHND